MNREKLAAIRTAMHPPWDDLREQRVLRGALARGAARVGRRRVVALGLMCSVAVLSAMVGSALLGHWHSSRNAEIASVPAAASSSSAGSVLTLADGSNVWVGPSGRIRVDHQTQDFVHIVQEGGEARYHVARDPAREFVVSAALLKLRVLGTDFLVKMTSDAVFLHVDAGRVRVEDSSGVTVFGPGEEVTRTRSAPAGPPTGLVGAGGSEAGASALIPPTRIPPSFESLLNRADRARAGGRLDEAASLLEEILGRYPLDGRRSLVLFTLGRVELARGNPLKAATHFRRCTREPLAEDALAEEANAWQLGGRRAEAQGAAQRYLTRYPQGPHAARMLRMLR